MNRYYFTVEAPTVEATSATEALEKLAELIKDGNLTIGIDDIDENCI